MFQTFKLKFYRLLRWSEKWTKTDMIYLARGGFWLNLGHVISVFLGMVLMYAFANFIDKETFGIYKYILTVTGILSITTLTGMGTALTKAVAEGKEGDFLITLKHKINWGTIGALASLILSFFYYYKDNHTLSICFLIASIFIPLMDSFSIYDSFLIGKKDFKKSAQYSIFIKIVSTIFMLIGTILTKNIYILILIYFSTNTALRYFSLRFTINQYKPNNETAANTINYGKHLSLINLFTVAAQYLDSMLVFNFIGSAQLAAYSIAIAIPENIKNLFKFIQPLSMPKFANQTSEDIKKDIINKMIKTGIIMIAIIIFYIFAAPLLFKIFFSKYKEAVFYSQLFSISLIYFIIALPISALQAKGEQTKLYQFYTTTSIFQIIILLPAAYFFGILGIITARLISRFFQIIFMIYTIKK
ncbi:oligosaccharide flippase family protein [Candidatus Falkowbacteria bacterium]|nr:oligosaccharide flippase family protein [Candidatus Falkowbacteria bacterium]